MNKNNTHFSYSFLYQSRSGTRGRQKVAVIPGAGKQMSKDHMQSGTPILQHLLTEGDGAQFSILALGNGQYCTVSKT